MEKNNKIKKTIYSIGVLVSLFLTIYYFKDSFEFKDAAKFSDSLYQLISNSIVLLFLFIIVYYQIFKKETESKSSLKTIAISVFFIFIIIVSSNFLINPRGNYPPSFFPTLVTNYRNKKVNDFANLDETPEMVIIGSSRALSLNPEYIEDKTGISSYNFAVTGTYLDEYLVIMRYVFDQSKLDPPKVILIDRPGFTVGYGATANRAPLQFFPYIDQESRSKLFINRVTDLINLHQFTESLYVLQFFMFNQDYQPVWTIYENGFGIPHINKSLGEAIGDSLSNRLDRKSCDNFFPDESMPILEEMVTLAAQHQTSILFYTSPANPEYVKAHQEQIQDNNLEGEKSECGKILSDFYRNLVASNSQVHSIFFPHPDDFNGYSDERGYYDGSHMTEINNNLLLDAMSETLVTIYQDSVQLREDQNIP